MNQMSQKRREGFQMDRGDENSVRGEGDRKDGQDRKNGKVGQNDKSGGCGDPSGRAAACEDDDDGVLVEKLRLGEAPALGLLWKRYAALLYTQAARILKNPSETEDVVVEVFEEAWKRVESYRPERARSVAWLLTLVRRRAIDRLRERRSHQRAEEGLQRQELLSGREEGRSLVEEQVRLGDLRGVLQDALAALPEEQRVTVCLAYYEGCTQREISERTHAPIGTVKSRLEMGLRKMRDALRRREAEYPCEMDVGIPDSRQGFNGGRNGGSWNGGQELALVGRLSKGFRGEGAAAGSRRSSGEPLWRRALNVWSGALSRCGSNGSSSDSIRESPDHSAQSGVPTAEDESSKR